MKRLRRAIPLGLLLLALSSPAQAQEPIELEATIGLQGYVMPYSASTVTARISADVLFVGNLQVSTGGVSLFTPVEVPAGSTKEYSLDVPAISNGRATVRLFYEGEDEAIASASLDALFPGANPLVGVIGADTLEPVLAELESVPFGRAPAVLRLQPHELDSDLEPLGYLVLGSGALDQVSAEGITAITDWVNAGGRLIGEAGDVGRINLDSGLTWSPAVTAAVVGSGEVLTVTNVNLVADWAGVFRDIAPPFLGSGEFMHDAGWDVGFPMFEAAAVGDGVAPGIPWLFTGLLVYVLVVGPINFYVLRRTDRRELAWVTIPAISLVMLAVLWVAGRSQVDGPTLTHASLVVQDESSTRATSAMIVVTGGGGELTLDAPAGWSLAPFDASMMFGRSSGLEAQVGAGADGGTRISFEMPGLSAATVNAAWQPEPLPLTTAVTLNEDILDVSVTNDSDLDFWAWGVGYASSVSAARGSLESGTSASTDLRIENRVFGASIGDEVMSSLGGWEWQGEETWRKVWPLADAVSRQESATLDSGPYFFGYTDDLAPQIEIDGRLHTAEGPALVVLPLEAPPGLNARTGQGEIVQILGADFIDSYPGWVYAHGADSLELRFGIDAAAAGAIKIVRNSGHMPGVISSEVYNWDSADFDEFDWLGEIPVADHISPTGDVMVRIFFEASEFNDLDLPAGAFSMEEVAS